MWPYKSSHDVLLMTLILNIYGFMGLAPFFFLAKVPFKNFFFNTERVWPYIHAHDVLLVTLILNIYGFVGLTSTIQA